MKLQGQEPVERPGPCETPSRDFNQSGLQTGGRSRRFERKPSGKSANGAMVVGERGRQDVYSQGLDPEEKGLSSHHVTTHRAPASEGFLIWRGNSRRIKLLK